MPELVKQFHAAYIRETGLPLSLAFDRQRFWYELVRREFGDPPAALTVDDLVTVLRYLKAGIGRGERNAGCLRFRNLIEQPDYFEEELMMARKAANTRQRAGMQRTQISTATDEGSINRLSEAQPQKEPVQASAEVDNFMQYYRARRAAGKHQST